MAGEPNWKLKYTELKAKFMNSVDVAFRLGVEEGMKQAQQENAMQQQAQAQEMAAAGGMGQGGEEAEGPESGDFSDQQTGPTQPAGPGKGIEPMQESEHPDGTELDQHIAKLESMINKSEEFTLDDLKKAIDDMKSLQKSRIEQTELKKSAMAIPEIAKALHKPKFKLGVQASHNMNSVAKSAVTMQHKIVSEIMEKWDKEATSTNKDIIAQLKFEGLVKE